MTKRGGARRPWWCALRAAVRPIAPSSPAAAWDVRKRHAAGWAMGMALGVGACGSPSGSPGAEGGVAAEAAAEASSGDMADATSSGSGSGAVATPDASAPSTPDASGDSGSRPSAAPDATFADASGGQVNPPFLLGADVTWTQQDVAGGATYFDNGVRKDILQLLKDHGFNFVRLRTFVDPTQPAPNPAGGTFAPYSRQGYGDLAHTLAFGQLIKAAMMGFLLDFHYSDTWADPGHQVRPAAWAADDLPAAVTHLHDYTLATIRALVAGGARPDIVQIGNEITPGMLLSPGVALGPSSPSGWVQLAQLLKAGIAAVHEVDPTIKIMLHIDRGGDLNASIAFVTNALANGVSFDVLGESCYVGFQGPPNGWQATFTGLASRFPGLQLVMAEYNADPANPTSAELRQANDIVFNLPGHRGLGTFFWEPTRSPTPQNPGMFTARGNVYTAIPACLGQYDQMKVAYGL